jgi:DNA repair protein RadC
MKREEPPRPRGFSEAGGAWRAQAGTANGSWEPSPEGRDLPFATTGPQGHRERMRQKLLERGTDAFADYELLEMLLFAAFRTGDTKPLAKRLINEYGSFARVLAAPAAKLLESRGLGPHSVAAIKLIAASAQRLARADVVAEPTVLNNWDKLLAYLSSVMARAEVEEFRVLYLDLKNRLLADEMQARGTVNHTPVYPREVVKRALEVGATALILAHNHPSGDPTPSRADLEMTAEIQGAAEIMGIVLHDHIIVGNGRHTSFRREGHI